MRVLIMAISLFLVACGGASDDESTDNAPGDTVGAEIAAGFIDSMDKAKDVEDQIQQSKDDIDAALEEAEGGVKD